MKNHYAKAEKQPSQKPHQFEKKAWLIQHSVCGIDEVGRGCLAGPLVAGAVILPQNARYSLLKDSKVLSSDEREKAARWIRKNCWYATASLSNRDIDRHNIYQATLKAMRIAFFHLMAMVPSKHKLKYVIVDAMPLTLHTYSNHSFQIHYFNYAESLSKSVAAASIIAKVTRDALMKKMAQNFPGYIFETNKGYGTKKHVNSLLKRGPSLIHRSSFLKRIIIEERKDEHSQKSLFTTNS